MANGIKVNLNLPSDADMKRMFDAVPQLRKHDVMRAATKAGGKVIEKRARELTPRGKQSDRDKRSAKQKAAADWNTPLWKTIKMVSKLYERAAVAVIGPAWPTGNKAYFFTSTNGRRVFYWGRNMGRVATQVRNWIVQAADETKGEQLSAMKQVIKQKMDEMWLHG